MAPSTAELSRGRQILDALVEYPLPAQPGTRDYVFHFVDETDPYGFEARAFLGRFYPKRTAVKVGSLEDLITTLDTDVTQHGVTHLREIIIVAHGNLQVLQVPLLNGISDTKLPEFKYLWSFSLACLQKDILDGKYPDFAARRARVVAHLDDQSWVTIRACRFGSSRNGLYAVFSFFGGRANVYAPTEYQLFARHVLGDGARFETHLDVHRHLVKQRFLPKDIHTPDRKEAIVRAIVDPGKFSAPFQVATASDANPPASNAAFDTIVAKLNARRIDPLLAAKFTEQGFTLTPRNGNGLAVRFASEETSSHDASSSGAAWKIENAVLTHQGDTYDVTYQVYVATSAGPNNSLVTTLAAEAHLDLPQARESLPIQLFLSEPEDRKYSGHRFILAYYTDSPGDPPDNKARFDAAVALLTSGRTSSPALDLAAEFKAKGGIDLAPNATITVASTEGKLPWQRITWSIAGGEKFLVKLQHPVSDQGAVTHVLNVFDDWDSNTRDMRQQAMLSFIGSDPDTPGPELAAYFDRFSLDELASVVDALRSPFKPGNSIYIHHAQEAMVRKKGMQAWLAGRYPDAVNAPLPGDPYSEMTFAERDDYLPLAYSFDFDAIWHEVKASNPPAVPVQADLFLEERLGKKFSIPDADLIDRSEEVNDDFVSASASVRPLTDAERQKLQPLVSVDKFSFDASDDEAADCGEFATVMMKWKEVADFDPAQIQQVLESLTTPSGQSYFEVIKSVKKGANFIKKMSKLAELEPKFKFLKILKLPLSTKDVVKLALETIGKYGEIAWLEALTENEFVLLAPFEMWIDVMDTQEAALKRIELVGKLTATRQWLRGLIDLTLLKPDGFPYDSNDIDLTVSLSTVDPYYVSRYYDEQVQGRAHAWWPLGLDPARLKIGFDEGRAAMPLVGSDMEKATTQAVDTLLLESGLDSCKVAALIKQGLLDYDALRGQVLREYARQLLDRLPEV